MRLPSQTWVGGQGEAAEEGQPLRALCPGGSGHRGPLGTRAPPRPHLREDLSATGITPGPRSPPPKVQVHPSVCGSTLPAVAHEGQTQRQASVTLPRDALEPSGMTLAVVHQGRQGLQSYLGVVGPHQEAPECQAALEAQVHTLIVLQLQLKIRNKRTPEYSHPGAQSRLNPHKVPGKG